MGFANRLTGLAVIQKDSLPEEKVAGKKVIALGGNPNVGKSTLFNSLTGLNQHTGNWPGKTVANATGEFSYKDTDFLLVDLPGTYSLMANSVEEEIARDFICFGNPEVTIIVVDATCIERNLNLALQTLEITKKVVICVNLMDEAKRKGITVDLKKLSNMLGVPVIGTSAVSSHGIDKLTEAVCNIATGNYSPRGVNVIYDEKIEKAILMVEEELNEILQGRLNARWVALRLFEVDNALTDSIEKHLQCNLMETQVMPAIEKAKAFLAENGISPENLRDKIVSMLISASEDLRNRTVHFQKTNYNDLDRKIDKYLTSKLFGVPIMVALLGLVFYITISGANYPSALLMKGFLWIELLLGRFFEWLDAPAWLDGIIIKGMFKTVSWVVSVMLPPMAIFFPLFTLLEDFGYLPRVAFNLDNYFKKACACGKQALSMCMACRNLHIKTSTQSQSRHRLLLFCLLCFL
jgi:ferrous iron transport protein B